MKQDNSKQKIAEKSASTKQVKFIPGYQFESDAPISETINKNQTDLKPVKNRK